eukprot:761040-Hanusia_phi.AAC.1
MLSEGPPYRAPCSLLCRLEQKMSEEEGSGKEMEGGERSGVGTGKRSERGKGDEGEEDEDEDEVRGGEG